MLHYLNIIAKKTLNQINTDWQPNRESRKCLLRNYATKAVLDIPVINEGYSIKTKPNSPKFAA